MHTNVFLQCPVILSEMVSDSSLTFKLCTFLTVLFIYKDVTRKRDCDIFPIETHLSFKMVYLHKNIKFIQAILLLVVEQISTKDSFLSLITLHICS